MSLNDAYGAGKSGIHRERHFCIYTKLRVDNQKSSRPFDSTSSPEEGLPKVSNTWLNVAFIKTYHNPASPLFASTMHFSLPPSPLISPRQCGARLCSARLSAASSCYRWTGGDSDHEVAPLLPFIIPILEAPVWPDPGSSSLPLLISLLACCIFNQPGSSNIEPRDQRARPVNHRLPAPHPTPPFYFIFVGDLESLDSSQQFLFRDSSFIVVILYSSKCFCCFFYNLFHIKISSLVWFAFTM